MKAREDIQKEHYDKQALSVSADNTPWEFDQKSSKAFLQTPYRYCEKWFRDHEKEDCRILDYGCGSSALAFHLFKNKKVHVTGIDISFESLSVARKRSVQNDPVADTTFCQGNCEKLPFKNNSFDYVFSSGTLSCLNLENAFSEFARIVKKDGSVICVDTLGHNPFLNINRWIKLKRGLKTKWHVDHVLKLNQLKRSESYFQQQEYLFFDFTTLILWPVSKFIPPQFLRQTTVFFSSLDKRILKLSWIKKFAFKCVCLFSRPCDPIH
jgi:ubiquinone/menaquinone biosynthesis C-methylase UbiE